MVDFYMREEYNPFYEHGHKKGGVFIPKIIHNAKEEILLACRKILLDEGYGALTIRRVAANCGIAPATVYNYFSSKEMLAASVMLEDWHKQMRKAERVCKNTEDCMEGFRAIHHGIQYFSGLYRSVWAEYGSFANVSSDYHEILIRQLSHLIRPMLQRLGACTELDPTVFLAEMMLHFSLRQDASFDAISPFVRKII